MQSTCYFNVRFVWLKTDNHMQSSGLSLVMQIGTLLFLDDGHIGSIIKYNCAIENKLQ